jgi:hypothetical protein
MSGKVFWRNMKRSKAGIKSLLLLDLRYKGGIIPINAEMSVKGMTFPSLLLCAGSHDREQGSGLIFWFRLIFFSF